MKCHSVIETTAGIVQPANISGHVLLFHYPAITNARHPSNNQSAYTTMSWAPNRAVPGTQFCYVELPK